MAELWVVTVVCKGGTPRRTFEALVVPGEG